MHISPQQKTPKRFGENGEEPISISGQVAENKKEKNMLEIIDGQRFQKKPTNSPLRLSGMTSDVIEASPTTQGAQKFPCPASDRTSLSNVRSDTALPCPRNVQSVSVVLYLTCLARVDRPIVWGEQRRIPTLSYGDHELPQCAVCEPWTKVVPIAAG